MSLTGLLDDRESPVRRHFEATYPNLSAVRFGLASEPVGTIAIQGHEYPVSSVPRFGAGKPKVLPRASVDGARGYDWGAAGTAFDYRLRLLLTPQDPARFTASAGARNLARRSTQRSLPTAWLELVDALVAVQLDRPDAEPVVADTGSAEVARMCGLLAMYEQLYRVPPAYLEGHPLLLAGPDATLQEQLGLVDERVVDDVVGLTALFAQSQPELLHGDHDLLCNPTFARSDDLGGADADLIVDGTLLELKAVKTPVLDKRSVWQVLGYLLADTSDRHRIRGVGWYFARHGLLWQLPVNEFLRRLHGDHVDMAAARAEFADIVRPSSRAPEATARTTDIHTSLTVERTAGFFPNPAGAGFDARLGRGARAWSRCWHAVIVSEVLTLVERFWGIRPSDVRALAGGMNSRTWMVKHAATEYVLKQVAVDDVDQFVAGCHVASTLADKGLVTGRPIVTNDGRLVVREHALALLEHVGGRELHGDTESQQRWIATTLGEVHAAGEPSLGASTATFAVGWLTPRLAGVGAHPWLCEAIEAVRAETDPLSLTWSVLHTDPSPEAFLHDDATGVTGLIDWSGAQRGPVLYDVASAVMYLGGPAGAATFLRTYGDRGPLGDVEMSWLDAFRRFRWAVQGAYFAHRLARGDLTGVADGAANENGLRDARTGLEELGLTVL